MVQKGDEMEKAGEQHEGSSPEQTTEARKEPGKKESMEDNLEKLAALNLSTDQSLQPRYSTAIIRLVSALAGVAALVLIYFILKFFI